MSRRQAALTLVLLVLMGAWAARAQGPSAQLAILIVGDQSNPEMTKVEQTLSRDIAGDLRRRGIALRSLPLIYYHVDKPAERRFCEARLFIQPSELLLAAVVEHENFVVRRILFQQDNIDRPSDAARELVGEAVGFVDTNTLPSLPSPQPFPSAQPLPEADLRVAFQAYRDAVGPILARSGDLDRRFTLALQQWQAGGLDAAAMADRLRRDLLPAARDVEASAQALTLRSPEVVHLHESFIEACSYRTRQYEALADGLTGGNDTLVHLADNLGQLAASAWRRWQLEDGALEQKHRP